MENPIKWYFELDKTQTIEWWVAAGTILLAAVTTATVLVQSLLSRSEHARFVMGYAPTLTVDSFGLQGTVVIQIVVRNVGFGPALNAFFHIEGTWLKKTYSTETPSSPTDPRVPISEENVPFTTEAKSSLVAVGDCYAFAPETETQYKSFPKEGLKVNEAWISYEDRFGNKYKTRFTDFLGREYVWERPKHLK